MKELVSSVPSPIVQLLDYSDDTPFLEPSLFAYFSHRDCEVTLEQVLYGYLSSPRDLPSFEAYANDQGQVYLPGRGHLTMSASNSKVAVDFKHLEHHLEELSYVSGTNIEICLKHDPLLVPFFCEADGTEASFDLDIAADCAQELDAAFTILQSATPELHACLTAVTRRVVIFRSDELASFATISAHGTAFLNASSPHSRNTLFFVEDLAHQCGHILFTAMTVNREEYFTADPNMPLGNLTGNLDEKRDLYTACHGIFTEAMMCIALYRCLEADDLSELRLHELLGRLSFIMKRFQLDLMNVQHEGLFTDQGQRVISECGRLFDEIYRLTKARITGFDFRNQAYTFCYDQFAELNPAVMQ